jgi:hypothetical protein
MKLPSPLRTEDTKPIAVDREVKDLIERRNRGSRRKPDGKEKVEKELRELRDYANISKFKHKISGMADNNLDDMQLLRLKNEKYALIQ